MRSARDIRFIILALAFVVLVAVIWQVNAGTPDRTRAMEHQHSVLPTTAVGTACVLALIAASRMRTRRA